MPLLEPIKKNSNPPPISTQDVAIENNEKEIFQLEKRLEKQENENKNIVRWIVGSIIFVLVLAVGEILYFHTSDRSDFLSLHKEYFGEIKKIQQQNLDLEFRLQNRIYEVQNSFKSIKYFCED